MADETEHVSRHTLVLYLLIGALSGVAFVAFDLVSEAALSRGALEGGLSRAHELIDHVLPVIFGASLGLGAHYLRLRARLQAANTLAARSEALRFRLQKVERDQAVWVLVAAVLHELKNPLHALGLLLDELGESAQAGNPPGELVERARDQCERALSTLHRLRTLPSTEAPRAESVDLHQILSTLCADARVLAAERGLIVRFDCRRPARATADAGFVRTILENLMHNSLQALQARNTGELRFVLDAEQDWAVIFVSDDGPALDPEVAEAAFTPLISTKQHGLGLGLPIARALARAMRGDLRLDPTDRKTFRLELPGGGPA